MRIAVIGAGIVGVSCACELQRRWPLANIVLLDKESTAARHQTGRNSGVIHAGVYYAPGSLKADLCRRGLAATYAFARAHQIAHRQTGKLVVATNDIERRRLELLAARAEKNAVTVDWLSGDQLSSKEPAIRGCAALHVHDTGIVDFRALTLKRLALFVARGGRFLTDAEVLHIDEKSAHVQLGLAAGATVEVDSVMVCAGLQADRLMRVQGLQPDFKIIPFRGEYYSLRPGALNLQHLIYPVPDPELPFLGVHLTLMHNGAITAGPNAVLGFHREGYQATFNWRDTRDLLSYPGLWRLLARHKLASLRELRDSVWKLGYLRRLQVYCPSIRGADLQPWPTGIRAQGVLANGELVQDFHFHRTSRTLHVCSAPSPAATAAQPIAEHLVTAFEELVA